MSAIATGSMTPIDSRICTRLCISMSFVCLSAAPCSRSPSSTMRRPLWTSGHNACRLRKMPPCTLPSTNRSVETLRSVSQLTMFSGSVPRKIRIATSPSGLWSRYAVATRKSGAFVMFMCKHFQRHSPRRDIMKANVAGSA